MSVRKIIAALLLPIIILIGSAESALASFERTYTLAANGQRLSATDLNGRKSAYAYDARSTVSPARPSPAIPPDLVDLQTREVWEIKNYDTDQVLIGLTKLKAYILLLNKFSKAGSPNWVAGTSYAPPSTVTGFLGRTVNVYNPLPGLITYDPWFSNAEAILSVLTAASVDAAVASIRADTAEAVVTESF